MADPTTQQAPVDEQAQALAAAQAGYDGKARGSTPPAEPSQPATTARLPLADTVQAPPKETPSPGPAEPDLEAAATPAPPAKPDPIAALTEQLSALRAQVQEQAKGDGAAAEVRKLHGEIGNINRTLKQLQTAKAADAPANEDKLAAALKRAEAVAEEFPDIAGPLVEALKEFRAEATRAKPPQEPDPTPGPQEPAASTPAQPALDAEQVRQQARQQAAIDAINELHPDRLDINKSPEFKTWLSSKPPEYQKTFTTTWNPAVLSKGYDEFKASRKARQSRQERLDAAAQPQGTGQGGPTTIPDEQAARRGYEAARAKRL